MALALLLITACAAIISGFVVTAHATNTNSTSTSNDNSTAVSTSDSSVNNSQTWGMGDTFRGGPRLGGETMCPGRQEGFMGGINNIEISSEYTANVTAILNNDTDVANLISKGYNVTSIHPLINTVIEGDGTLTTQATTAIVTLQNGTSGYATAHVDISQLKVTQIVIITRTVIDKSTS